jgi:hypothetical protein
VRRRLQLDTIKVKKMVRIEKVWVRHMKRIDSTLNPAAQTTSTMLAFLMRSLTSHVTNMTAQENNKAETIGVMYKRGALSKTFQFGFNDCSNLPTWIGD